MIESGRGGNIIFMSSQAGKRGEAGASAYSASKFGILGLMQCLALELSPNNIRVNAVCPGNADTPMLEWLIKDTARRNGVLEKEVQKELLSSIPAGRLAEPDEIANVCVFLASPLASYITGESINVDGGQLSG
jgi:NAD(P)-dependent dehydrogenase (short-subunit alcohol dehydrogenase family)